MEVHFLHCSNALTHRRLESVGPRLFAFRGLCEDGSRRCKHCTWLYSPCQSLAQVMCSSTRRLLVLLVIAGGAATVQSIVIPAALTPTPKSHYQPYEAVGADYVQLGQQKATFAYNTPFSELGCSNPGQVRRAGQPLPLPWGLQAMPSPDKGNTISARGRNRPGSCPTVGGLLTLLNLYLQGFTGVTALTGYGFPVLKLLVEFDDGHSATFGNCTDFCYATHIKLLPGELITRLSLYDFNYSQNGTVWSAFGGLRLTTAGSAGKRVLNLGYSGVTPWAVGERPAYPPHAASLLCSVPAAHVRLDSVSAAA